MRILLTGGTGLLGLEMGKKLSARGDELVLLVRKPKHVEGRLPFRGELFEWNHSKEIPERALDGVDAVINLAGESIAGGRWTAEKKLRIRDSRVEGTRSLVRAIRARHLPLRAFVQGSAIGIYGDRGDEVLDALSTSGTGFLADVVREWESAALELNQNLEAGASPVRLSLVRTAMVLARDGGALSKMLPAFRARLGGRLGWKGAQWMSWIHLEDIVNLFIFALDSESVSGVLEGSAPEPVTNARFTAALCAALDVMQGPPIPAPVLKVVLGEMSSLLLGGQRVIPVRTQEMGFRFQFKSIEAALNEIFER